MAYNPASPVNLVYKKYTPIPAPFLVTVDVPANTAVLSGIGMPSWLFITNVAINGATATFYLKVSANSADTLPPGNLSASFEIHAINYNVNPAVVENLGSYTANIEIQDTILLGVSPTVMTFTHNDGEAVPSTKPLQIISENNWNITSNQSWITLSTGNGNQNATVQIGVDPSALSFGVYEATVTVDDGIFTKDITVYLTVTAPDTAQDYLYLNPQNFEFLSEVGVANAAQKIVNIDAGDTWASVISHPWLVMSAENGASGVTDITLSVDSAALSVGVHQAEITITSGNITKKTYVALRVVALQISGLADNTLYFVGDRPKLSVGSIQDNSFLVLAIEASTAEETNNHPLSQPYFKGVATALIGQETNHMIKSFVPSANLVSRIKNDIRPVVINISAFDENRFSGATASVATYQNLKFLKGNSPKVAGRASYIPSKIYVSNKGIIQLSVISENAPPQADITGDITATINGGLANGLYLYTLVLNLSEYALVNGNEINVAFGGQSLDIQIHNDYMALNTISFENEWGEYEYFETKGIFTEISTVKQKYQSNSKEGLSHTRILQADEDAEFSLSTGYIQTQEEVRWLSKILNAKRLFLYLEGQPVEVILTVKKMLVYQTRNHTNSYQLTFKKAIK